MPIVTRKELIFRTLGEDAVFFSGLPGFPAALAPQAKCARCDFAQAAYDTATGADLQPLLWIQCGQMGAPDPEGGYLCEEHMTGWYCGACGIQLPEFCGSVTVCPRCAEDIEESM